MFPLGLRSYGSRGGSRFSEIRQLPNRTSQDPQDSGLVPGTEPTDPHNPASTFESAANGAARGALEKSTLRAHHPPKLSQTLRGKKVK